MTIYFPKTGATFESAASCRNHIRKNYSSSEEAYLDVYNLNEAPKCKYCGAYCEYKSITKGYLDRCSSKECKNKHVTKNNRRIADAKIKGNLEFTKYVLDNIDIYRERIQSNKPYFDEFFNKQVITNVQKFLSARVDMSQFYIKRTCIITGEDYALDLFRYKREVDMYVGSSHKSRMFRDSSLHDLILYTHIINSAFDFDKVEASKLIQWFEHDINLLRKLKEHFGLTTTEYISSIEGRSVVYDGKFMSITCTEKEHINLRRYYSRQELIDKFNIQDKCKFCGSMYDKYNPVIDPRSKNVSLIPVKEYCNEDCYFKILKTRKQELYPVTDETRKKLSDGLKEKIAKGEFTPKVTNSRCNSRIISKDGISFRSTWEAVFYSLMKHKGIALDYEDTRVPYVYNERKHTYIVDFSDHKCNILYEVKPTSNKLDDRVVTKEHAAIEWCNKNGYKFLYIDDDWFHKNVTQKSIDIVMEYCIIDVEVLKRRMYNFLK